MKIKENIDFLVIAGPTAVGKSELGIELAKNYNGEVINGDSIQVYKGLDIGSAKVTNDEMQGIEHHLIDIKEADEEYTVSDFKKDATTKIAEIKSRGKLPIIVGGTGLYLNALIYNYENMTYIDKNDKIYIELLKKDKEEIFEIIQKKAQDENIDIHVNNVNRNINYAYKVLKGLPLSENLEQNNCQVICLTMDRELLRERINLRVDKMIEDGLVDEVSNFMKEWPSQQGIGYKEIHAYLNNEITLEYAIEKIKTNTARLAKKQITWFKNKINAEWYRREGEQWELHQN